MKGTPRKDTEIAARQLAEDVKLDGDVYNKVASKLGGGEKRRLSIAIALTGSPPVIFFGALLLLLLLLLLLYYSLLYYYYSYYLLLYYSLLCPNTQSVLVESNPIRLPVHYLTSFNHRLAWVTHCFVFVGACATDEPTTGLDPAVRRNIWSIIKAQQADGRCIVITTHSVRSVQVYGSIPRRLGPFML